ncbi:MAG: hypothetical protein FJ202_06050 [Gemmatimonadetes bacterium]|nr:hypothetical protein [Gemmatimonadota bacterium]
MVPRPLAHARAITTPALAIVTAALAAVSCRGAVTAEQDMYDGPLLRMAMETGVVGRFATAVRDDHLAVAWFGVERADTAVFVSRSLDGGNSFSAALRVSPVGEPTPADLENGPRVELILDPDGFAQPFLAWTRARGDAAAIVWSYTIDGTTYSAPAAVRGSSGRGRPTLHVIARDTGERVVAMWSIPGNGAEQPREYWLGSTAGQIAAKAFGDSMAAALAIAQLASQAAAPPAVSDVPVLVWTDSTHSPPSVMMQPDRTGGGVGSERTSAVSLGPGAYPVVARPSPGPVIVWVSGRSPAGEINVIRVR